MHFYDFKIWTDELPGGTNFTTGGFDVVNEGRKKQKVLDARKIISSIVKIIILGNCFVAQYWHRINKCVRVYVIKDACEVKMCYS